MTQIQVCQLDEQGVFIAVTDADESPLEPGVFLIPRGCVVADPPSVPPGKQARWVGEAWTLEDLPSENPEPVVPRLVSMRQARLALLGAGLLQGVEQAIEALPEPKRSAARIEWDYSSEVHRDRPFVQQLSVALGLDGSQLDALFVQAAQL